MISQCKVVGKWEALSKLVSFAGSIAIDAVGSMEARIELGTLKEVEAVALDYLLSMVNYMSGAKSTIAGAKQMCKDHKKMMFWRWHIMHLDT